MSFPSIFQNWLPRLALASLLFVPDAHGQTIGETVEEFVETELDASKKKKKPISQKKQKPKTKQKSTKKKKSKSSKTKPKKPYTPRPPSKYPKRVIGKMLEIDPQVGIGYRGWLADQYPSLSVATSNYLQWSVGVRGRLFKAFRIYRAFYQSSGLDSPRNTGAVVAQKAAKAVPGAATKALGFLGYEINFVLVPMVRYEARSYEATAIPLQPVRIIPYGASKDQPVEDFELTSNSLEAISTFETFVIGLHYNDKRKRTPEEIKSGPPTIPYYFGVGLSQYRKPYQVRVGEGVLEELVFNSRFRGAGLALGFDLAGGAERLQVNFHSDVGLGEIRLTEDLTLNETLPNDWLMGYARGELKVGYTHPLLKTRPTLLFAPQASVGGTTFFYVNKGGNEEGTAAPLANWDLLWSVMAKFILPL